MFLLPASATRLIIWAAAIAFAFGTIAFYGGDLIDALGAPVEGDFHNQLLASRLVFSGDAEKLYHATPEEQREGLAKYGTVIIGKHQYPPAISLLLGPLTLVTEDDALVVWKLLMVIASLGLSIGLARSFTAYAWRLAAFAVCWTWSPLLLNLRLGHLSIFLAVLFLLSASLYVRDSEKGASLWGLAAFKPSVMIGPALAAFAEEGLVPITRMAIVAGAVIAVPFAFIGPNAFIGWLHTLTDVGQSEAGGGHAYNQSLTANLSLPASLELALLVCLAIVCLVLVQAIRRRGESEAALAVALVSGLLLNPHSLIYDWTIALVAVAFLRRSRQWSGDLLPGLALLSLFAAGQWGWSTVYDQHLIKPLTLWALVFVFFVAAPLLPRDWASKIVRIGRREAQHATLPVGRPPIDSN